MSSPSSLSFNVHIFSLRIRLDGRWLCSTSPVVGIYLYFQCFCLYQSPSPSHRAFSERPHQTEADTDLSTFHLLLEAADPKDSDTHSAALTVIAHASHLHRGNVRFGQCLSVTLKRLGPHMNDLEGVRFAVNTHTSSFRKLLESQMKRLDRKRW